MSTDPTTPRPAAPEAATGGLVECHICGTAVPREYAPCRDMAAALKATPTQPFGCPWLQSADRPAPEAATGGTAERVASGLLPPLTDAQQTQIVHMLMTDTEAPRHDGFFLALAGFGFVRSSNDPDYGTFWTLTDKGRARASMETAFLRRAIIPQHAARRLCDAIGRDAGRAPTLDQARGYLAAVGATGKAGAGPTVEELGLPTLQEKLAMTLYEVDEPRADPWSVIIESDQGWHRTRVDRYRTRAAAVLARLAERRPSAVDSGDALDFGLGDCPERRDDDPIAFDSWGIAYNIAEHMRGTNAHDEIEYLRQLAHVARECVSSTLKLQQAGAPGAASEAVTHRGMPIATDDPGYHCPRCGLDDGGIQDAKDMLDTLSTFDIPSLSEATATLSSDLCLRADAIVSAAIRQAGEGDRAVMLGAVAHGMVAARADAPGAGRALGEAAIRNSVRDLCTLTLGSASDSIQDQKDGLARAILSAIGTEHDAALVQAGQGASASFQARNAVWMVEVFAGDPTDLAERVHRFTEESLELGQALGQIAAEAHALVDYVHGRPKGDPAQEVGGTMTTLALLCAVAGIDMDAAGEAELARCSTPEIMAKIREKRSKRYGRGPLPGVYGPDFVPQAEGDGWRQPCSVCFTPNACRSSRRCGAAHLVSSAGAKP